MVKILSFFIICYKKCLSPLLGQHCRFYPTCSSYCLQALETHGAIKGSLLGAKRLCRCHPLNEGGIDHVPPADTATSPSTLSKPLSKQKEAAVNGY